MNDTLINYLEKMLIFKKSDTKQKVNILYIQSLLIPQLIK